ncbi:site-specific integrase, partial [Mycobacterium sp. ITM-2017-0098]
RTPDRRQTDKRGFRTKREAQAFAATVEVSKMRGEYVAPTLGKSTVAELAPDWLGRKKQATAVSHYRMLESAWRVHVAPKWGKTAV